MNRDMISALASELTPGGPGGDTPTLRFRQGAIVSVQANGTATVTIGGDTTQLAGVKVASCVCPVPGASCWLAVDGRDLFVIATLAPAGPAWGTMRQSAAQAIGNAAFTAYSWANRTEITVRGVTATNSGLEVLVPGLYSITASPALAANATGQRHSQLTVNGTVVAQGASTPAPSTQIARLNASTIVKLAIGDVVNVTVYQNSGGSLNTDTGPGAGTLTVTWLGPAA